ncbi:MAG TPA: 4Fe-4S dicluster-binding protein [Candidatus Bathyarchaeia archaeon]|nr:4Fe-4S dicluster-binding protein [Candidatus Bathyarchaeia archaeon]
MSKQMSSLSQADVDALEVGVKRLEVNYRGIFQKSLAKRITKDLVYVAHSEGKTAFSNGRYSDDPQRNGIPCANFAHISDVMSEEELEAVASAAMDIDKANVIVVLDDTMVKGVEPWGHYGNRPINQKAIPGCVLLVVSKRKPEELVRFLEKKTFTYKIAILPGIASFAGLWYYRDDGTDVRVLGAIAKVAPDIISLDKSKEYVKETYGANKVEAVQKGYDSVSVREVQPTEGRVWPYAKPILPAWNNFEEGIAVPAIKRGFKMGPKGQNRNPNFKTGTNRTQRPIVRFDICTKCTLCWYECPDECFDPTQDGLYDVNYDYCTGCGRCAEVCPVKECIVMVDELNFDNNNSPWESYTKDSQTYTNWAEEKKGKTRMMPSPITGKGESFQEVAKSVPMATVKGRKEVS